MTEQPGLAFIDQRNQLACRATDVRPNIVSARPKAGWTSASAEGESASVLAGFVLE